MPDGDWGAAGEGALGGAATGAMIGSAAGPWGTAIGAGAGGIIGGAMGYFGSGKKKVDKKNSRFQDRDWIFGELSRNLESSRGAQAPQAGRTQLGAFGPGAYLGNAAQLDPAQQAQFREQQMAQAARLGQIATGQQQGAGELAAQRQAARAVAQQQAMARMGRGMSGAGAARGAARNVAGLGAAAAGQSQIAALQDQQAANSQLGGLLAQGREADIGMAGQNAQFQQQRMLQQGQMDQAQNQLYQQYQVQQGQMDQQTALTNLQAELQQRGLNAQQQNAVMQQWLNMNQAEMAARLGQEQVQMSQPGITGPLLQAAGQIGAAYAASSDERVKHDIKDGNDDVDEMLDKLKAHSYRYKDIAPREYTGAVGDGRRLAGIMAQALESSAAGKSIVRDTDKGKVIDMVGGLSATLASVARLNERLRKLEGKGG